jgi:flagellar biosynthesis/type III secretory pathway chaperone
MQQPHQLPDAGAMASMHIDGLMQATLRMSDLMSEESEMLRSFRFKDIGTIHEEKLKLSKLLEAYQHRLATDPSFVQNADRNAREQLLMLTDDLAFNTEENLRQVAAARAVNQRVLQAIMDVVSEQHRPGTYGPQGQVLSAHDMALSMNLNQKA